MCADRQKLPMRTKEAFLFSVERLLAETGELYLWTLTFREVPESDDWAMGQWQDACRDARREFKGVHGLRVIELHKNHGLHIHLLLNRRFSVERMLRIFWPHGFGRIHVCKADLAGGQYLAKYLGKRFKERLFTGRRRLWAAFGGFRACRNKDVEYDGPMQRNKWLLSGLRFAGAGQRAVAYGALMACSGFGDYADWPNVIKERFLTIVRGCDYQVYNTQTGKTDYYGRRLPTGGELAALYPAAASQAEKKIRQSVDTRETVCDSGGVVMAYFDSRSGVVRTECVGRQHLVYEQLSQLRSFGPAREVECPF